MFGLSLIRLAIYAAVIIGVLGGAYTGYRIWRHQIWVEGRDAALAAVAEQNSIAAGAAKVVEMDIDKCFEANGVWDITKGECVK